MKQFDAMATSLEGVDLVLFESHPAERQPNAGCDPLGIFLDSIPAALFTCSAREELPITFASGDLRKYFDLDPSRALGRSGSWIDWAHPADGPRIRDPLKTLLNTGAFSSEFRLRFGHSRYRRVQNELRLVRDAMGRPREVVGYLLDTTQCNEAKIRLEKSSDTLRELASHLQSVREAERSAIARAIHDEMGQALTALKIDLVRLRSRVRTREDAAPLLASTLAGVDGAITAVQRIMADLRPSVLDDLGLVPAIEWYLDQFQNRTGIPCAFDPPPQPLTMNNEVTTALFRILQESLQNVARHAEATHVEVTLVHDGDWLNLGVRDNGKGISRRAVEDGRSFGLLEIRERAEIFGGKVEFRGKEGAGTAVTVSIHLPTVGGA